MVSSPIAGTPGRAGQAEGGMDCHGGGAGPSSPSVRPDRLRGRIWDSLIMAEPGKKRPRKAPAEATPSDQPGPKKRRAPRKAAGSVVEVDRERAELMSRIVEGARRLCAILEGAGSGGTRAGSLTEPIRV